MPFPLIAAGIGAAASLIGGAMNARAQARENEINRARQDNQLQRMMADAGAAGIHPVAAMGLTGGSYGSPVDSGPTGFGSAVSGAGGRISDVMLAQQDFQVSAQQLELERMRLENDMRITQLAEAQSRSMLFGARQAFGDGPELGGFGSTGLLSKEEIPAQPATDDFGDVIGDIFFGLPNFIRAVFRGEGVTGNTRDGWAMGYPVGTASFGAPNRRRMTGGAAPGMNFEADRNWRLSHPERR